MAVLENANIARGDNSKITGATLPPLADADSKANSATLPVRPVAYKTTSASTEENFSKKAHEEGYRFCKVSERDGKAVYRIANVGKGPGKRIGGTQWYSTDIEIDKTASKSDRRAIFEAASKKLIESSPRIIGSLHSSITVAGIDPLSPHYGSINKAMWDGYRVTFQGFTKTDSSGMKSALYSINRYFNGEYHTCARIEIPHGKPDFYKTRDETLAKQLGTLSAVHADKRPIPVGSAVEGIKTNQIDALVSPESYLAAKAAYADGLRVKVVSVEQDPRTKGLLSATYKVFREVQDARGVRTEVPMAGVDPVTVSYTGKDFYASRNEKLGEMLSDAHATQQSRYSKSVEIFKKWRFEGGDAQLSSPDSLHKFSAQWADKNLDNFSVEYLTELKGIVSSFRSQSNSQDILKSDHARRDAFVTEIDKRIDSLLPKATTAGRAEALEGLTSGDMKFSTLPEHYKRDTTLLLQYVDRLRSVNERTEDSSERYKNQCKIREATSLIPETNLSDESVVTAFTERGLMTMQLMPTSFRGNPELVLGLVKAEFPDVGTPMMHQLDEKLLNDREFIKEMVSIRGDVLNYFPASHSHYLGDKELVLSAYKDGDAHYLSLYKLSPELKADRDVVSARLKRAGYELLNADEELRSDPAMIVRATESLSPLKLEKLPFEVLENNIPLQQELVQSSYKNYAELETIYSENEAKIDASVTNAFEKLKGAYRELGITEVDRFDRSKEIIRNRYAAAPVRTQAKLQSLLGEKYFENVDTHSKPLCVISYPQADWNDAFTYNDIDELTESYRVLFYENSTDHGFVASVREATRYAQADILVIGGHGSQHDVQLSGDGHFTDGNYIDLSDQRELLSIRNSVKPGGVVVSKSCSTAKNTMANGRIDNIAELYHSVWPQATVYASTIPQNNKIELSKEGLFKGPGFTKDKISTRVFAAQPN